MKNSKKILSVIMAAMITAGAALSMTACGSSNSSTDNSSSAFESSSQTEASGEESSSSDASSKSSDSIAEGTVGDSYIKVLKTYFPEDYDGNKCLAILFEYTNNSDEADYALSNVQFTVYQDGIQLENAYGVTDNDNDYYHNISKKIKPGKSIKEVQYYKLDDEKNDLEIEVSELFTFSNDPAFTFTVPVK